MAERPMINRSWPVAGGLSMNLALGTLLAWSVFVRPFEREFGWTRAQISPVSSIAGLAFALAFLLGARLQDKKGPVWASIPGGVLVSVGFFMCAWTTTLGWLTFWLGGVAGMGTGFAFSTPIPVVAKWFPDRRGLALALVLAAHGGGAAIFGPLAGNWLIPSYGWRATFMILGLTLLVMTLVGAVLLQNPPMGYEPEGWTPAPAAARSAATTYAFTPTEMLRTRTFLLVWAAYALGTSASLMVISQIVPFARSQGLSVELAVTAIFIGALGNLSGHIFSGWLSDALGRLTILRLMIAVSAVALFIFFPAGTTVATLYLLVFVVYYCYGTLHSVNAATVADFWGTRNLGVNYYLLWTASGMGSAITERGIGGGMFAGYKDYRAASYTAAILAVLALGCVLLAKPLAGPPRARAGAQLDSVN